MDNEKLEAMLLKHEGLRLKPYKCTSDKITIGVGRNLENAGISRAEALYLLGNDIRAVENDLYNLFKDFYKLPENIQLVIADMRFNLGAKGFRGFKKMIAAIRKGNFKEAAEQMKDSKWFGQVGKRGEDLYNMMIEQA